MCKLDSQPWTDFGTGMSSSSSSSSGEDCEPLRFSRGTSDATPSHDTAFGNDDGEDWDDLLLEELCKTEPDRRMANLDLSGAAPPPPPPPRTDVFSWREDEVVTPLQSAPHAPMLPPNARHVPPMDHHHQQQQCAGYPMEGYMQNFRNTSFPPHLQLQLQWQHHMHQQHLLAAAHAQAVRAAHHHRHHHHHNNNNNNNIPPSVHVPPMLPILRADDLVSPRNAGRKRKLEQVSCLSPRGAPLTTAHARAGGPGSSWSGSSGSSTCSGGSDKDISREQLKRAAALEAKRRVRCKEGTVTPASHVARVTKSNKDRACEFCLQKFSSAGELSAHRTLHTTAAAPDAFLCVHPGCDKQYGTGEGLRLHVRNVHLGAKVWQCLAHGCSRSFVRQSDLRMHIIRIHSGSRPFPCPVGECGKAFACHSELRRHVASCHKQACPRSKHAASTLKESGAELAFVQALMFKVE